MHHNKCLSPNCLAPSGDTFAYCALHRQEKPVVGVGEAAQPAFTQKPAGELSGGNVNYYLLKITDPKRLKPYECEAEDIIEALEMSFAEGNVFKALWRSCAMRVRGHGKRGQDDDGVYDGDKISYYGDRIKVQRSRKARATKAARELAQTKK